MAEDAAGRAVGYGRINHIPWEFHPQTYYLNVTVDPALRQRGIGSAIYDALLGELQRRGALAVRSGGATGAEERVPAQGILLPRLGAEGERDPEALRKAYELQQACGRDVPAVGQPTDTTFEMFVAHDIEAPTALLDAFFLAKDGDRYVGVSLLQRRLAQPDVLSQHLTGLLREYRGRGIAMALKLQTVKYAQAHGYREIRTGNDARNRPMLRINEAMGFVKEPAWITFEKRLGGSPAQETGARRGILRGPTPRREVKSGPQDPQRPLPG